MEFMSQEGYDKLVAELNQLVKVELPRVIDAISEARDKGDLSENFEYRAAKREQSRLLGRKASGLGIEGSRKFYNNLVNVHPLHVAA